MGFEVGILESSDQVSLLKFDMLCSVGKATEVSYEMVGNLEVGLFLFFGNQGGVFKLVDEDAGIAT